MEAFFLYLLTVIFIDECLARSYYGSSGYYGSSSVSGGIIAAIVVPVVLGIFLLIFLIICITKKCCKQPRMGVMPLSTQVALAQQENQYAPPSFKQGPPYGQPPPYGQTPFYNQPPSYGQAPSYNQPPPYSTPSAPRDPITVTENR